MGIDKSLTDDFPSVMIDGVKYHYGKETNYGQYLVENADLSKDYWCFDTRADLVAFLVMLPESADRTWFHKEYSDWSELSPEEHSARIRQRQADLRQRARERQKTASGPYFNVLQFDESGSYSAPAVPLLSCDDAYIRCEERETKGGQTEWIVTLHRVSEGPPLKFSKDQALTVASGLIRAAQDAAKFQESSK